MMDAELTLVTLLRTALPSVSFYLERPSDPETYIPFVVVQHIGGTGSAVWDALTAPLVTFEAWGNGDNARADARALGESVRAALHTIANDQSSSVTEFGALNRVTDVTLPFVVPSELEAETTRRAVYTAAIRLRPGA